MASQRHKLLVSVLILTFLAVIIRPSLGCKGCVNLDEFSFQKILPKFKYTLVKYDIAYPYGAKHDVFVKFADELTDVKDLIVGEVGVKDYGDKDNEAFAKSQGVDSKQLPSVRLYEGGRVHVYEHEELTVERLREFLLSNSEIHITLPGCLEEFDKIAIDFTKDNKDWDKLIKKADGLKTDANKDVAKVYMAFMKKIQSDGLKFVKTEQERLKRILKDGKLTETKKKDLQNKLNILHSFKSPSKDDGVEKKEEL